MTSEAVPNLEHKFSPSYNSPATGQIWHTLRLNIPVFLPPFPALPYLHFPLAISVNCLENSILCCYILGTRHTALSFRCMPAQ